MGRFEPKEALKGGRCAWCGDDALYQSYHDHGWGKPVSDDRRLFELIVLEGAQAGLSWLTILHKREGYRRAFHGFDPERVKEMTEDDVERLMSDEGIVRNRAKIRSAIGNAKAFCEVVSEWGSFERYILSFFEGGVRKVNRPRCMADIPVRSAESDAISADLKRRGFKFFGSTVCYAFLQSAGFVNDHFAGCEWG